MDAEPLKHPSFNDEYKPAAKIGLLTIYRRTSPVTRPRASEWGTGHGRADGASGGASSGANSTPIFRNSASASLS